MRTCPAAARHCGVPACARRGYGILAATVGRDITERVHGFVELAAPRIARPNRGGTQAVFDTGVTWLLTNDIQLDAALSRGLKQAEQLQRLVASFVLAAPPAAAPRAPRPRVGAARLALQ